MNFKCFFENLDKKYIFYHGSFNIFNKFSPKVLQNTDYGHYGYGFYFTPSEKTARLYGPNLYKCELILNNPLHWNKSKETLWEQYGVFENGKTPENSKEEAINLSNKIKADGYDAIFIYDASNIKILEVCVFDSNKIKIITKQIASHYVDDEEYT